jgi:hypothetical protein
LDCIKANALRGSTAYGNGGEITTTDGFSSILILLFAELAAVYCSVAGVIFTIFHEKHEKTGGKIHFFGFFGPIYTTAGAHSTMTEP